MRAIMAEFVQEGIEFGLLLQQIGSCGPGGFFLEREVHTLVAAVLLRMAGPNTFDSSDQGEASAASPQAGWRSQRARV